MHIKSAVFILFGMHRLDLQQVSYAVTENRTRKAGEDSLELKVFKKPFASGGCRLAYYAQDSNGVR